MTSSLGDERYPACVTGEWLGTDVPLRAHHERPKGMGLHICAVVPRGSGSPSEHVEVVNDGAEPVPVTGLELTACSGQEHELVYAFPEGELAAGQTAYVYSGSGKNQLTRSGDLILYAGLRAPRLEGRLARRLPAPPGWQDHRHDARGPPAAPPRRPRGVVDSARRGSAARA